LFADDAAIAAVVFVGLVVNGDGVETTIILYARVSGTDDVIVAVQVSRADATTCRAGISYRAGVIIVAGFDVELVDAATFRITVIIGAKIVVIAVEGRATYAIATLATVCESAGIVVVTWHKVIDVETATFGVTGVICAGILIIAIETGSRVAAAAGTNVWAGACVAIAARLLVCHKLAPSIGIARVIGAWIQIFTTQGPRGNTLSEAALVVQGTDVVVRAGRSVKGVDAAINGAAGLRSAEILVVTVEEITADATPLVACIIEGARVVVVAADDVVGEDTALPRDAGIIGTKIAVVAVLKIPCAVSLLAEVGPGASIAIVASSREHLVDAAVGGAACFRSTWVLIIADDIIACRTGASCAEILLGASVAVFARC